MDTTAMLANLQVGTAIMLIGMGVVFSFLVVMIWVMNISAVVIKKLNEIFPEAIPQPTKSKKKQKTQNDDELVAVAIAAAVARANNAA
ncbi:OadG family protein [bacterium]|nr:OadG family protein [bacterium]